MRREQRDNKINPVNIFGPWYRNQFMYRVKPISSIKKVLIMALNAVACVTQATQASPPQTDVVFQAFAEYGVEGDIQLVNGIPAKRQDWPTVLNAQLSPLGTKPAITCTGVLVGPGVFLTAAHCFDAGLLRPIRSAVFLEVGGQKLPVTCRMSDEYMKAIEVGEWRGKQPRVSQDYALCSFKVPSVLPAFLNQLRYENIDTANVLTPGTAVLMTGFGCSDQAIALHPTDDLKLDGLLRIGDAKIYAGKSDDQEYSSQFASIQSPLESAPALCRGDSGGPLFSGATTIAQSQPRKVRAVNSTVQLVSGHGGPIAISRVTPLATDSFRQFAATWLATDKQAIICGVNGPPRFKPCRD